MADSIAWMIEMQDPQNPGCVMGGAFLGIVGWYAPGSTGGGSVAWLSESQYGLRFARHEDAAKFLGMMRLLTAKMPYNETLPGLRPDDPLPIVCDHMWLDSL